MCGPSVVWFGMSYTPISSSVLHPWSASKQCLLADEVCPFSLCPPLPTRIRPTDGLEYWPIFFYPGPIKLTGYSTKSAAFFLCTWNKGTDTIGEVVV
jgi:hypothetical protein